MDNAVEGLVLGWQHGRPGQAYFVTDRRPVILRDFLGTVLSLYGVDAPIPDMDAETAAHLVPVPARCFVGHPCTLRTDRAATELGHRPIVPHAAGFAAVKEALASGAARRPDGITPDRGVRPTRVVQPAAEIEQRRAEGLPVKSVAGALSDERREQLEEIDPSWYPAWPVRWQRCFHLGRLHPEAGRPLPTEPGDVVHQGEGPGRWGPARVGQPDEPTAADVRAGPGDHTRRPRTRSRRRAVRRPTSGR
ncbi:hypothetical protein ACFY2V_27885 [Streptomyces eurythermus]|uniref:hypothetical protein n=1 Tax=Streptomyces eurythermus TaxID=42237 RepID=UPI00369080B6